MIQWFKKFCSKHSVKKIAFIDGDQPLPQIIAAYQQYLVGIETHLVRAMSNDAGEPRALRGDQGFNKIYLRGYSVGKEVVDKFIGAYIQKAVDGGYTEISVVSNDYDFIDIFKMAAKLNPDRSLVFRIIVPNGTGKICDTPTTVNLEVLHMKETS
jgi:hypothetical protein